jgi:hypothetical protein
VVTDLLRATAALMTEMDSTNELEPVAARSVALHCFRRVCSEALSVGGLVETRLRHQVQQDVHEFLLQLVEALSVASVKLPLPLPPSPSLSPTASDVAACAHHNPHMIPAVRAAAEQQVQQQAQAQQQQAQQQQQHYGFANLLQQSQVSQQLSQLQHYFEGQRCAWMLCKACSKVSTSMPATFITEEVGLAAALQRLRMEMAQKMNIQFEKDEVVSCGRCAQQMRAPCEAAALRCANCRAVINPSDCKGRSGGKGAGAGAGAGSAAEPGAVLGAGDSTAPVPRKKMGRPKSEPEEPLEELDLEQLLGLAKIGENLDGYRCDHCSQTGTTHRADLIFVLPQVGRD